VPAVVPRGGLAACKRCKAWRERLQSEAGCTRWRGRIASAGPLHGSSTDPPRGYQGKVSAVSEKALREKKEDIFLPGRVVGSRGRKGTRVWQGEGAFPEFIFVWPLPIFPVGGFGELAGQAGGRRWGDCACYRSARANPRPGASSRHFSARPLHFPAEKAGCNSRLARAGLARRR
jgi:hypothetical protein